jgi:hypothetical protein
VTGVSDPSIAAGGGALVTTVQDLGRFLDGLLEGRLFRRRETLRRMLPSPRRPTWASRLANGLRIERRVAPGGIELTWAARRAIPPTAPVSAPRA